VGPDAILADYPDTATTLAAAAAVRALDPVELVELVPAERTLLLVGATAQDAAALETLLRQLPAAPEDRSGTAVHTVPVVYDGEDLDEVAALLGMSAQALVTAHTSTRWTAAFGGFAPGFAYLLPAAGIEPGTDSPAAATPHGPPWEVPRRAEPRTRVPSGAVALASRYSAIYPRPSPGGWQLIGSTDVVLFDPERSQPALLMPGDHVQFEARRAVVRVDGAASSLSRIGRQMSSLPGSLAGAVPEALVRRRPTGTTVDSATSALEVLAAGPLTLIQDAGRPGHAHIGVPASGAFDRGALARANLAVGNPVHAAVLEVLIGPVQLRALASTVVALDGAPCPVSVRRRDRDSAGVDLAAEASAQVAIALDPGDLLELGPASTGLRTILAVRGGVRSVQSPGATSAPTTSAEASAASRGSATAAVLGSLSRDTLSALGPAPLTSGDMLATGPLRGLDAVPAPPMPVSEAAPGTTVGTAGARIADAGVVGPPLTGETGIAPEVPDSPLEVPVSLGPREGLLGADAVAALLATTWTVRADSDRVGLRLDGDPLPVPQGGADLPSEAMVRGAIQVPPSGLPVIFGPDHPTTGGYPVIGVVHAAGMDRLAQAPPGSSLRFRLPG
jgi:KipI family sensor histidine kinase inhibitor